MLEVQGLSARRARRRVIETISARFPPGRVTAVLGPNGAGKSTLLACLAGLLRPEAGSVRLDGVALADLAPRERARRIGLLPQGDEVHWDIDVETLVGLGRLPHCGRFGLTAEDRSAVARAMTETGVAAFAHRAARQLSGGERARVLMARVLAGEPDWLLADEPLANLDPAFQLDMLARLRGAADAGRAVVLVLHDLTHVARIADDALLLREGRVVAAGAVADVLSDAALGEAYGIRAWRGTGPDGTPLLVPVQRV
ncbi:MAG: ABC transporter ATP-binding protein [Thermaurantiacus sp.]